MFVQYLVSRQLTSDPTKKRHIKSAQFGSIQRIVELVELFQVKQKNLTIYAVFGSLKSSRKMTGFSRLAQGLLAGSRGHIGYSG